MYVSFAINQMLGENSANNDLLIQVNYTIGSFRMNLIAVDNL